MRRKDREITDTEKIFEIMQKCDCCRIGLVDNGEAYIVPMNFGIEKDENGMILYFHSAKIGRKISLLPYQVTVAFEMDTGHGLQKDDIACEYSYFYQSVMGKGKMTILQNVEEKAVGLASVIKHYAPHIAPHFENSVLNGTCVFKLSVTEITCKSHSPDTV